MHSRILIIAISFILLALVLYTVGVWAERLQRKLKWWHTVFFWTGFTADTIGTTAMSILSGSLFAATFHGITGNIAISLMGFHATWATVVLTRKNEKNLGLSPVQHPGMGNLVNPDDYRCCFRRFALIS
jgi:uncharacterized repeat protein (TIGR03987 family)